MGHIGVGLPARLHGLAAGTGWFIEDCELGESFSTNEFGAVVILDVPTLERAAGARGSFTLWRLTSSADLKPTAASLLIQVVRPLC